MDRVGTRNRLADAAGLVAGYGLDAWLGDPRRFHPVAGFGTLAQRLERRVYRPDRRAGAAYTIVAVGTPALLGLGAAAATRGRPVARFVLTAAATWAVLGGRTLRAEGRRMGAALRAGDVPAARRRLSHLCGRDAAVLDEPELARATVESVAENTSDAVVAPLFWGAMAGIPGLLAYRAANTLDAMVGHRSARYARFGTPAARLDDLLNLAPARLTAVLTIAATPRERRAEALRVWRRDRADHPSPNAGQCESAMAGSLGVRLGGRNVYFGRSETRPFLGDGPKPDFTHIDCAAALSSRVGQGALLLAATAALLRPGATLLSLTAQASAAAVGRPGVSLLSLTAKASATVGRPGEYRAPLTGHGRRRAFAVGRVGAVGLGGSGVAPAPPFRDGRPRAPVPTAARGGRSGGVGLGRPGPTPAAPVGWGGLFGSLAGRGGRAVGWGRLFGSLAGRRGRAVGAGSGVVVGRLRGRLPGAG